MKPRLILASESPRRYELLAQIGLACEVIPSKVTEEFLAGETPREHVIRLAGAKASIVGSRYRDRWVVAADTVVCINDAILGKPRTPEEAMSMLARLSGQKHRVLTGFSVLHAGKGREESEAVESTVKMKRLTAEEMRWYVKTGEPSDKAGGYAIQGIGSFMIESIRGSYTNVVGLPLCELVQMLTRLEAIVVSERGFEISDP